MSASFDIAEVKRRMEGALGSLKHELGGLRTGRASASMLEPVHVEAYGASMQLSQVATVSVPEGMSVLTATGSVTLPDDDHQPGTSRR